MKIAFVGDSSGLRVRPKGDGDPYPILVERILKVNTTLVTKNEHKGGALLREEILNNDRVISFYPDYLILSFGVEKFPRLLPRKLHHWIYVKTRITHTNGRLTLNKITKFTRKIIKAISPNLTRLFNLQTWTSPEAYEKLYYDYVRRIQEETNAKCILLACSYITDHAEQQLPGGRKKAHEYTKRIYRIADKTNNPVIDVDNLLRVAAEKLYQAPIEECEKKLLPDGYHFNAYIHNLIAREIVNIIEQDLNKPKGEKLNLTFL